MPYEPSPKEKAALKLAYINMVANFAALGLFILAIISVITHFIGLHGWAAPILFFGSAVVSYGIAALMKGSIRTLER